METKDPRTTASFVPTLSYGSWKTRLAHFEANTGLMPQAKGGRSSRATNTWTPTATALSAPAPQHVFLQISPAGREHATLTFMGEYNNIKIQQPERSPSRAADPDARRNFGQTNNSARSQRDYYGSNYQSKQTDTSFIALRSDLGAGWKLDDKFYTFSYNNKQPRSPGTNAVSTKIRRPARSRPARISAASSSELGAQRRTYAALSRETMQARSRPASGRLPARPALPNTRSITTPRNRAGRSA